MMLITKGRSDRQLSIDPELTEKGLCTIAITSKYNTIPMRIDKDDAEEIIYFLAALFDIKT